MQTEKTVEAAANNPFHQQMIGTVSYTDAHSEIELPFGGNIEINCGNDLLLLFA